MKKSDGIEMDKQDAIDLIDEVLAECRCYDVRSDSPYVNMESKDKDEFAEYIIDKFLFKDKIMRNCDYWKEGVGCIVHEPNRPPLKNPDCTPCTYWDNKREAKVE